MPADFDRFMQERTPHLLRLARVLTDNGQDAEDLTQEALIRLHAQWKRVSGAEGLTAYSNRVLVNCHLDSRKKRRVQGVSLLDVDAPTPDSTSYVDDRDAMRGALTRLPRRQRAIVVLRFYEQFTTREIADLMDIAESSVRSGLARALGALQSALADHPIT